MGFQMSQISPRFCVYRWTSLLLTGIVFKFLKHVHNLSKKVISIQKDPRLIVKKSPKYANVAEIVRTLWVSVASHFFLAWEAKINRYAITYLHLFPFCNTYSHSPYFHWYGNHSTWPQSKRGSFWMQIKFFAEVEHVHMKLENNAGQ